MYTQAKNDPHPAPFYFFGACHHHFRHRYQSGPGFSEMNNDADLIFIAVWQQMIGFANMANLFDFDGGAT